MAVLWVDRKHKSPHLWLRIPFQQLCRRRRQELPQLSRLWAYGEHKCHENRSFFQHSRREFAQMPKTHPNTEGILTEDADFVNAGMKRGCHR